MNDILEKYIVDSPKLTSVMLSVDNFENLIVDTVMKKTGVDLSNYISSGKSNDENNNVAVHIDRVLLYPEEEELVDDLYYNPFNHYVLPGELFAVNVVSYLFDVDARNIRIETIVYSGRPKYQIILDGDIINLNTA